MVFTFAQSIRQDRWQGLVLGEGGAWSTWRPETDDVTPVAGTKCSTTTLRLPGMEPQPMCIMGQDQYLSNVLRRQHRWYECRDLVRLFHEDQHPGGCGGVIVEVGANIGACSLELVLSLPNTTLLLFEPNPVNFFHLTSSLKLAYQAGRLQAGRVIAYPLGAGRCMCIDVHVYVYYVYAHIHEPCHMLAPTGTV